MFQYHFDMTQQTPVQQIEIQILDGLAVCKSVHDIAQDIVDLLDEQSNAVDQDQVS